jgi:predicted dehydrogenase
VTVRVGFFGGGLIARYHAAMLQAERPGKAGKADAAIVAVHDPDRERAATFAEANGAEVTDDEGALIDGCDAVYVCTWTAEHRRLVELAVAAGKPVFCEKPLATTLADARAMVDTVQRAGVTNQVGLVLRDSPAFLYLRHLVRRPESGRVMSIVFRDDQYIPIQGMYGSTWRADKDKAGAGTLIEHSIHDLDQLEWLIGPVASVNARTSSFHRIDGIEDVAVVNVGFADGGIGTLTSVWHDLLARPSLRRVEVLCERGFFVLEGDVWGPVRWTRDGDEGVVADQELRHALADEGIARRNPDASFIDAVVAGEPAYPSFDVALRPHALVDAIYRSAAADGAPVEPES